MRMTAALAVVMPMLMLMSVAAMLFNGKRLPARCIVVWGSYSCTGTYLNSETQHVRDVTNSFQSRCICQHNLDFSYLQ